MKRCISLVVALVAVSSFAQIRVEKADGSEELIPAMSPVTDGVIVEFRDAPLAVAAARAGKTAMATASYRQTFARFRGDLAAIGNAEVRWEYFQVFNGASVRVPRTALSAIAALPYVKKVYPDREVQAMAGAATVQIGADKFWSQLGSRGKGVVVAVIDTGIDYNHEALGGGIGPGYKVLGGYDFVNRDNDPFDDAGHGTHVAGIIAGDSATITGVAPEASLMAYKVLNASGSGTQSNVIAAIERAVDPNGDGDTSDHVDVANLSLGGAGGPDDPGSRAINNGTLAGVVFCVAAGNSGKYHNVSSPGTANSAITVGAVDVSDNVAVFSSRGPTPKDLTMKPEIAAPGVGINSSLPGNKYGPLSGTSMATPHVAGAVALLKSLHRDWTPAQIKIAIMSNAAFNDNESMATGSGRLDVLHAATGPLIFDPPALNFGLDPVGQARWNQARTIHVTNRSAQSVTYGVRANGGQGMNASISAASITLAPGASTDLVLSIDIDNAAAAISPKSLSGGGNVVISNSSNLVQVPWTFVKAVRAITTWDKDFANIVWLDSARTTITESVLLDSNASEVLLPSAGAYDVAVNGYSVDALGRLTRANFIYLPEQTLNGDTTIATTESQATHRIRTATLAADGTPMQAGTDQTYGLLVRMVWPDASATLRSIAAPAVPLHDLYVNDVPSQNKIVVSEAYADFRSNSLYVLQHQSLQGVAEDHTFTVTNLKSANVRLLIPPAPANDAKVQAQLYGGTPGGASPSFSFTRPVQETSWNGRVYVTADTDAAYRSGIAFNVLGGGVSQYVTPQLRADLGAVTTNGTAMPWLYSGDQFVFGGGPRVPLTSFAVNLPFRPSMSIDYFGPLGENRGTEKLTTTVTTFGANGQQIASVTRYPVPLDLTAKSRFTIETTNSGVQFPDLPVITKLTMTLDSSRADYLPPTLTSLFIVDAAGRAARDVDPHGTASLFFSAADYAYPSSTTRVYQPLRGEATAVSYRYAGGNAWTALPVTQMSEDAGTESRVGGGVLYRADLAPLANVQQARFDLRIDLADVAGNTTTVIMQPAFTVGGEYPPRRRAAR